MKPKVGDLIFITSRYCSCRFGVIEIIKNNLFPFNYHAELENGAKTIWAQDEFIVLPNDISPIKLEFLKLLYK